MDKKMPTVGPVGGDKCTGAVLSATQYTPNYAKLQEAANAAKLVGNYARFWSLRRAFLLAQARNYKEAVK
jgi:hypothetical protein